MMIKHFTDTPMLPVQTTTVPIAAHVKMVTLVTVLPALIMINVHSEQTNECVSGDNTCHATLVSCTNTDGSYRCVGNEGYQGNGMECEDFNECTNDPCHADANCTNNVGSFVCTKIQMRYMNEIVSRVSRKVQKGHAMMLTNVKKTPTTVLIIQIASKLQVILIENA